MKIYPIPANATEVTVEDAPVSFNEVNPPINQLPTVTATASSPTLPDGKINLNAVATDADGVIVKYEWVSIDGVPIDDTSKASTFATVTLPGTYRFQVTVTDDDNGVSKSLIVSSTVGEAANIPPTVNAGSDQSITLPTNTVVLNGTGADVDGTITSYKWEKLSGSGAIVSPNAATTQITGLTEGESVFRLTVADNKGATKSDDVKIVVNAANVPGETSPLTFTQLTTDYTRPMGGFEGWLPNGSGWDVAIPNVQRLDDYDRFGWGQLDLSFSALESRIKTCIDKKGKFGFGVMTYLPGAVVGWKEAIRYSDGTAGLIPQSVHDAAMASTNKDIRSGSTWWHNPNFEGYLAGWEAFHVKMYNWLNSTSYKGVKYKDAINYYEIRGYGRYGEWNMWGDSRPKTSEAALLRIINAVKNTFKDIWLLTLTDGYVPGQDNDCTPNVSYLLMTGRNEKGKFGARKDHMGSIYFPNEDWKYNGNSTVVNGVKLGDVFRDGWKESPYIGEPALGNSNGYAYMDDDITKYHFSVVGNGNYGGVTASNIVAANKVCGYRMTLTGGSITTNTGLLGVTLNWSNTGNAPVYEDFEVQFELRQGTNIVRTLKSTFTPTMFLPGTKQVADTFTGLPSGTYELRLKIINPSGYRTLPLSINGRQSDGTYILKTSITL